MKILLLITLYVSLGCSTVYYNFWETLGREKRDLLRSNIINVQKDQQAVEEQFKDSLDRIRKEYSFKEGGLEKTYDKLSTDYEESEDRSETLSNRIDKVEEIAEDLFDEWEDEASDLSNKNYRKKSFTKLKLTKEKFRESLKKMRTVEKNLQQILKKFKDRVVFLKHNLNAKVIGNFKTEFKDIEVDINKLIKDIDRSNSEAESFIKEIK